MEVIYKTVVGSQLYGLATPESDVDYKGLFLPDRDRAFPSVEQTIGISHFNEHSVHEFKTGEGADKEEGTYYSVRYFIELLFKKGNPNLIELPFCGPEFVKEVNPFAQRVLDFAADNLITRKMIKGYLGYFGSQIKAFETGTGRHREKRLEERREKITTDMYDGKMASHAYRIGVQGIDLFTHGRFNPTLEGEQLEIARTIKQEKFDEIPRADMIKLVKEVEAKLVKACDDSPLPSAPDLEKTNKFLIDMYGEYYGA